MTPPAGATLHLGGDAYAHPSLADSVRPLASLTPYPGNPRRGDQDAITASIRDLGLYRPVIVQQVTGHVLAGNHTLRAVADLGGDRIPVTLVDLDDTRAAALVARDNRTSDLGTYDDTALADLLADLLADDALPLAGYSEDDLDALRAVDATTPPVATPSLADRFVVPPFSVLDQRSGPWRARRDQWLALGIKSELGRDLGPRGEGAKNLGQGQTAHRDPRTGKLVMDVRPEQVQANLDQAGLLDSVPDRGAAEWLTGDSRTDLPDVSADLIFSCPPYADLEVYSDDPADLSTMPYPAFLDAYRTIIREAVARLRDDRFAVWVVGEVRDRRGIYRSLVPDTIRAFIDAGADYYGEAILVSPAGSLPIRAGRAFASTRKLGRHHQTVLTFVKGDPRAAADACGEVDVTLPDGVSGD